MLEIPAGRKFTFDNNYGLVCAMSYPLIGGSEVCDKRFKLNFSVHGPRYLATGVKNIILGEEADNLGSLYRSRHQ